MKVALLLSGGIDSAYSAYLLQQQGYEVEGFYLKLHRDEKKHLENIQSVKNIGKHLNIKIHVLDARELFEKEVYNYFISSYKNGFTPNPCTICNPRMKFGFAFAKAMEMGFDKIASGHYALSSDGYIKEAVDDTKDQSYFLFGLKKDVIEKILFPLGGMYKSDVKKEAFEKFEWFSNPQTYKESQEICFVDNDYIDILKYHFDVNKTGNVRNSKGEIIGKHKGYMHYTVGKRRGFDVPLAKEPHYVLKINPRQNSITVGLFDELAVSKIKAVNFSLDDGFVNGEYHIKARYKSQKTKAYVEKKGDLIHATLHEPLFGVARGQALVIYKDDLVLGGGFIA